MILSHTTAPADERTFSPALLVTVDTEEEGLWEGRFRCEGNTVENIRGVPWFQSLCEQYGIRPTYVVDTPVVEDDRAVEVLREIADDGRGEIGAHLHVWCAPPLQRDIDAWHSYLLNLPPWLQREKLTRLTERIEARFDRRPTSFRAGRYGLDAVGSRLLHELGYVVDSSVIPLTDYTLQGGPNFLHAPVKPYFPSADDLIRPADCGELLEVPVSVGFASRNVACARMVYAWTGAPVVRRLRVRGLLDRLGLVQRIKLSPEQSEVSRMNRLVDALLARRFPCVVMMLHSSSLVPGLSPYVPDLAAFVRLRRALEATFEHCIVRRGLRSATLTQFAQQWMEHVGTRQTTTAAML